MSLPLKTFDLTTHWFDLMQKHIFVDERVVELSFTDTKFIANTSSGLFSVDTLDPVANYYTTYNYPLLNSGEGDEFVVGLTVDLAGVSWDRMDFGPMPVKSNIYSELSLAFKNRGYVCNGFFRYLNWYLEVGSGGYEGYLSQRPSRLRNTIKRKQKALYNNPDVEVYIFSGTQAVAHISDFQTVYEHSWKNSEPYPQFISDMVLRFSALGWIRLGVIYHEQVPIAAQLWVVKDDVASIYKLAYVEGYEKLSAGTVLMAKMMAQVIDEDKVSWVDFLVGDEPYKREWMSDSREVYGIRVYNSHSLKGRVLGAWATLKNKVKPWLKR